MNRFLKVVGISAALASLVACGDDGSSKKNSGSSSNVKDYEEFEDLPHCTKSHYGELAHVQASDSIYECTSKGWVAADPSKLEELNSSSSKNSSSSAKIDSADVAEIEIKKVESVTLTGYAQKGSFADGSTVTVYGLDSALEKTKTKFTGKVEGGKGAFTVKDISLESQYALVEVLGFFENEVSGKMTSLTKTRLAALVDLSEGSTVKSNVNVFTQLELERIKKLVNEDHYNVVAAKKQAFKELSAIFGNDNGEVKTSTDLSLDDATSAGKALLASSIMMVGTQSMKMLADHMDDFSVDFAENGSWDDALLKTSIADDLSTNVDLAAVRNNVKAFGYAAKATDFDKFVYEFWVNSFELGECNEDNETEIQKNGNKKSATYGKGFVCASNRWHLATALDTELGVCTGKMEGEYKTYGSEPKYYTCQQGEWNEISKTAYELKSCTEDVEKSSKQYTKTESEEYFVCKDKQWTKIDYPSFTLKLCTENREGEYALVDGTPYHCVNESWKKVSELEYELQASNVCEEARVDKVIQAASNSQYYVCDGNQWNEATQLDYEIGVACTDKIRDTFKEHKSKVYYCRDEWTVTTLDHMDLGTCTEANSGSCAQAGSGFFYECVDGDFEWVKRDEVYCTIGVCSAGNEGEIGEVNGSKFLCANKQWEICDMTQKLQTLSNWIYYDNNKSAAFCLDRCDEMMCESGMQIFEWQNASVAEMATGMRCVGAKAGTIKNGYTCVYDMDERGYAWRTASEGESWTGTMCNSSNLYKVQSVTNNGVKKTFACDETSTDFAWRTASTYEEKGGAVCNSSIVNQFNKAEGIVCRKNGSSYSWGSATTEEKATGYICTSALNHSSVYSGGYVCDSTKSTPAWRAATAYEKEVGYICRKSNVDSYYAAVGVSCVYENSTYKYRAATAGETANKKVCTSSVNHYQVSEGYVCDNTNGSYAWRSASNPEKAAGSVCYSDFNQKFAWVGSSPYRCTYSSGSYSFKSYSYDYVSHGGRTYKIIDIGDQIWTAENMGYSSSSITSYCYSGTTASTNCSGLGRLYSFAGALNKTEAECGKGVYCSSAGNQGVCPTGYHVPTNSDWTTLFSYIGASGSSSEYRNAGKYLKSATDWNNGTDDNGLDLYGFSAMPNGYGRTDGSSFSSFYKDVSTLFWTSTYDTQKITAYTWRFVSYDRTSSYSQHDAIRYSHNVEHLAYVRCVKKK